MSRRRRIIARLAAGLAALLVSPLLLALWLGATESGLRTLLHWSQPWLRAELARGSLLGGVTIDGLHVEGGGLRLEAARMTLRWRPAALLAGRLHLTEVSARGVDAVWRDPGGDGGGDGGAPPPLTVVVERFAVEGLRVDVEGEQVALRRVELAARGTAEQLTLSRWSLEADEGELAGEGRLSLLPAPGLDQRIRWRLTPPGHHPLAGTARLSGGLDRLELALHGREPQPVDLQLTLDNPAATPRWELRMAEQRIDPSRLADHWPDHWPALPLTLSAHLRGGLEQARIEGLTARRDDGARLTLNGRVDAPWAEPRLTLHGEWEALGWPLEGAARWRSEQGSIDFEGTPSGYRLALEARLRGDDLPPGHWRLEGEGDSTGVDLQSITGSLLAGRIDGEATVHWDPRLRWRAKLRGEALNPAEAWPRWPGQLAAEAAAEGEEQRFTLHLKRLAGKLRGYPIDAAATLSRESEGLTIDDARLSAADNRLALAGRLTPAPRLSWSVVAPHLAALLPDAAGALHGEGRLAGDLSHPAVSGRLAGEGLRYLDHRAERLSLEADLDLGEARPSRVRLALDGLASPLLPFDSLRADGHGLPEAHQLELRAEGDAEARLRLDGGLRQGVWSGRLEGVEWNHPDTGRWRQRAPAQLRLASDAQHLAPLCLSGPGRLCVEGERGPADRGRLLAELSDLPAQLPLKRWEIRSDATLAGRLNLDGKGDGELSLSTTPGVLRRNQPGLPEVALKHEQGRLHARLDRGRIRAETRMGLGELGAVEGTLKVGAAADGDQRPLDGHLDLTVNRLDWLTALLPQLAAVEGRAEARIDLGGRVGQPRVEGVARLAGAGAELPELGIRLDQVALRAEGSGRGPLRLSGEARSAEGAVRLTGRLATERPWSSELKLSGSGFEAINTADARVVVDPDLQLDYRQGLLRVSGRIAIPEARITPVSLEGTVGASRDVEILGRPTDDDGPRIDSDLTIELGEQVRLAAAGFEGRLQGRIHRWEEADQPARAEGELTTHEALYRIYGQRLTVESGRLRFTGGPADNPELDLTATRESGGVTAGAHVRGPLREPRLTLFSEPAMNQSDTLSYLLFGRPGDRLSGSEGELLLSAAAGLVTGDGDGPVQAIGQALGLDEARIRGDGGLQGSALVLGKYLSPRLYLGYAAGLFEPSGTVELRYRLSDRWEIKSESGTAGSGADLLFTLEK